MAPHRSRNTGRLNWAIFRQHHPFAPGPSPVTDYRKIRTIPPAGDGNTGIWFRSRRPPTYGCGIRRAGLPRRFQASSGLQVPTRDLLIAQWIGATAPRFAGDGGRPSGSQVRHSLWDKPTADGIIHLHWRWRQGMARDFWGVNFIFSPIDSPGSNELLKPRRYSALFDKQHPRTVHSGGPIRRLQLPTVTEATRISRSFVAWTSSCTTTPLHGVAPAPGFTTHRDHRFEPLKWALLTETAAVYRAQREDEGRQVRRTLNGARGSSGPRISPGLVTALFGQSCAASPASRSIVSRHPRALTHYRRDRAAVRPSTGTPLSAHWRGTTKPKLVGSAGPAIGYRLSLSDVMLNRTSRHRLLGGGRNVMVYNSNFSTSEIPGDQSW